MPSGGMLGMLSGGRMQGDNHFGNTRAMSSGRWLDVAFRTQLVPFKVADTDGFIEVMLPYRKL